MFQTHSEATSTTSTVKLLLIYNFNTIQKLEFKFQSPAAHYYDLEMLQEWKKTNFCVWSFQVELKVYESQYRN